jgi:hypothetical protein
MITLGTHYWETRDSARWAVIWPQLVADAVDIVCAADIPLEGRKIEGIERAAKLQEMTMEEMIVQKMTEAYRKMRAQIREAKVRTGSGQSVRAVRANRFQYSAAYCRRNTRVITI